jgi:hypothetical protein
MNERIKEIAVKAQVEHCISHVRLQEFAELIIRECMAQCEQVAADADAMTKSEFVTDAGRMLHEGMWGGAKNCSGQIREHFFGVEE